MLIRLEHNGRIIHETGSDALTGELTIGRSHACEWPIPKEDGVASSRHAALFKKGKAVWLKDLESTNGTFHNGKKIDKRKLAIGDKISIGNCVLCAEADRGGTGRNLSEVVVLSGKTRGQKKPLTPPVFTIGSDPSSSLVFLDMLVSRRHAEILVKEDGSCWIRDLGSKNGTSVNGMPLRDDKERLLKDGDCIACSHFELEFRDGAVKHSNKQTWLRLGILLVTLLAGLGAYQTYQRLKPSAEAFVKAARRLAAKEEFDQAAREVEQAVNARHASRHQVAIEEMRRLIGVWKRTRALWQNAQEDLERGEWVGASRTLGVLQASKREVWEWNAQAAEAKDAAAHAKTLLDAFLQTDALLKREDLVFAELESNQTALDRALDAKPAAAEPPAYLTRLAGELRRVRTRQASLLAESRQMETALNKLGEAQPPYDEVVRLLEQLGTSQEPALKRRAQVLAAPVKALANSYVKLGEAAAALRRLAFQPALTLDLALPTVDACAIEPRVSLARQNIEKIHANLKLKGYQLEALFTEAEKRIGREGDSLEGFRALRDPAVMEKVMACDSVNLPLPKRSRSQPAGEYDRLLGIEAFYAYLSALPEPLDPAALADLPFLPLINQTREALQKMDTFLQFMAQADNQWLMADALAAQVARMKAMMQQRDELVNGLTARAGSATDRTALIAGGLAARLATASAQAKIKDLPPEEWLAAELKRQRTALLRMNEEYTLAAPTRQIEIRTEILKAGLPGDPAVRRMWAMRDAAAAASPAR
ncbi:MAG: FHA domain-containing protein [Kiritimatiellia bacterium]|jgi:pSer/pThr/pTyr-binding forkhead associated (FHA) protein|nr:FHA domain-containing protein [Kiritimatiellia bacterium]